MLPKCVETKINNCKIMNINCKRISIQNVQMCIYKVCTRFVLIRFEYYKDKRQISKQRLFVFLNVVETLRRNGNYANIFFNMC